MNLRRKDALLIALATITLVAAAAACRSESSPGATFKAYYEAALKRDVEGMKRTLSKDALKYFAEMARVARKTLDEGLRANAEAMQQRLPATRNEKVNGDEATLEIKDERTGQWETVYFVKEEDAWKLALERAVNR